jgi:hypothetical protein
MMKKLQFTAALGLLVFQLTQAQVNTYAFSQGISQYSAALTGSFVGHSFQDDTVNTVNIPFSFLFNGNTYTSTKVSSNGFISFASPPGTEHNPISGSTTQEVVSIFGQDLQTGMKLAGNLTNGSNTITGVSLIGGLSVGDSIINSSGNFGNAYPKIISISGSNIVLNSNANITSSGYNFYVLNGAIRTQLYGTAPNRMFEIEFRNFSRKNSSNEFFNFKIRLWETIERITMVYGQAAAGSATSTCEIGLKGASNSDFKSRKVTSTNSYISSQPATVITDNCLVSPNQYPFGGVTYTWRPVCEVPNFSLTTSATNSLFCTGRSVTLTASTSSGSSHYWFGPGVGTQTANPQIVVSPTANASYTLYTDEGPCTSTAAISLTMTLPPYISVSPTVVSVCAGQSATLTATGGNTYTWVNEGTTSSVVVSPSVSTVYTVSGSNGACATDAQGTVAVTQYPALTFVQSHTLPCNGTNITITAQGATTYSWNNGQATAVLHVSPQATTVYTVNGTTNGCTTVTSFTQQVKNCTGLDELGVQGKVNLFPNPFADALTIQFTEGNFKGNIVVADVIGRVVGRYTTAGNSIITLQTGNWVSGIYIVTVSEGEKSSAFRIVKQ